MARRDLSGHVPWKIVVPNHVIRQLEMLPEAVQSEAKDIISELSYDPEPPDSKALRRNRSVRSIRFISARMPTGRGMPFVTA